MVTSKNSWHCRVYKWWYANKYDEYVADRKEQSNLCPYMRAVLFWAPFRAIFCNWIVLGEINGFPVPLNMVLLPLIFIPLPWELGYVSFAWKHVLKVVYLTLLLVALTIVLVGCTMFAFSGEEDGGLGWGGIFCKKLGVIARKPTTVVVKEKLSGFFELVGEWLRSAHDGICPEIRFK